METLFKSYILIFLSSFSTADIALNCLCFIDQSNVINNVPEVIRHFDGGDSSMGDSSSTTVFKGAREGAGKEKADIPIIYRGVYLETNSVALVERGILFFLLIKRKAKVLGTSLLSIIFLQT
ncbi:hypothetical protein ACJX0J_021508, partial [Zea mays]